MSGQDGRQVAVLHRSEQAARAARPACPAQSCPPGALPTPEGEPAVTGGQPLSPPFPRTAAPCPSSSSCPASLDARDPKPVRVGATGTGTPLAPAAVAVHS